MRRAGLLFLSMVLFLGFTSCMVMESNQNKAPGTYKGSVPFIFVERDVEFAIYPNGEFDFAYVGPNYRYTPYNGPRQPFSYNGGYDYDVYLQFDRFGAVIQVESVPIFYDYYGRIIQAGNVVLRYSGNYVTQIGNMHVIYKKGGKYLASSGYVNSYNRHLSPQPWHSYYSRPYYPIVYTKPYRENYKPKRYSYDEHRKRYENRGRSNYDNGRRTFVDPITKNPRRENSTEYRREAAQSPSNSNRGRSNTTNPRNERTTKSTKSRRESSTTPSKNTKKTEDTKRGRSSTNKNVRSSRREATPSKSNMSSRRGDSNVKRQENSRRPSVRSSIDSKQNTSTIQETKHKTEFNNSGNRRGRSSYNN